MVTDDDLRAKLTKAMQDSPNARWLTLPGPVDISRTFIDALMPVVREALADASDDGWHAGYREAEVARRRDGGS